MYRSNIICNADDCIQLGYRLLWWGEVGYSFCEPFKINVPWQHGIAINFVMYVNIKEGVFQSWRTSCQSG